MILVIVDVNVMIAEAGICTTDKDYKTACHLYNELQKRRIPIVVTPTMIKDFEYLAFTRSKGNIRNLTGKCSPADSYFAKQYALGKVHWYINNATVAEEGTIDIKFAHYLARANRDFEDNLIVAIATRIGATCIITNDKKMLKNGNFNCITPLQALRNVEAGIWD